MDPAASQPFVSRPVYSEVYPLDEFYAARGEPMPEITIISADKLQFEPCRSLLVHQNDMTSTLERYCGEPVHIEALARNLRDNEYYREVVLVLDHSKKRVEFGAIKINLTLFPVEAQHEIMNEREPLGRILNKFRIRFSSRPSAYFAILSDGFISGALHVPAYSRLHGRRNSLLDSFDRPLAEIVEILAFH